MTVQRGNDNERDKGNPGHGAASRREYGQDRRSVDTPPPHPSFQLMELRNRPSPQSRDSQRLQIQRYLVIRWVSLATLELTIPGMQSGKALQTLHSLTWRR